MDYSVALLIFGILLLLVGLVGKVKAKELEIGTEKTLTRVVVGLIGIGLITLSLLLSPFFRTKNGTAEPDPQSPTSPCQTLDEMVTYSGGFVFADSDTRKLELEEVVKLTQCQKWIARNEIYARKGRLFKNEQLKRHFSQFEWYRPKAPFPGLNEIEATNVETIRALE